MRVDFYHLTVSSADKVIAFLAEKINASSEHALFVFKDEAMVERYNDLLWKVGDGSFIPHGSKADGNERLQPIFLSTQSVNVNGAVFVVYGEPFDQLPDAAAFKRCFIVFNGKNNAELEKARDLWRQAAAVNAEAHYWQDSPTGWSEKK